MKMGKKSSTQRIEYSTLQTVEEKLKLVIILSCQMAVTISLGPPLYRMSKKE